MSTGVIQLSDVYDLAVKENVYPFERFYRSDCVANRGIFGNGWNSDIDGKATIQDETVSLDAGCGQLTVYTLTPASRALLTSHQLAPHHLSGLLTSWPATLGTSRIELKAAYAAEDAPSELDIVNGRLQNRDGSIQFDGQGELTLAPSSAGSLKISRDAQERIASIELVGTGAKLDFTWARASELTIRLEGSAVSAVYDFDARHNLTSVRNGWGNTYLYRYDPQNRLTRIDYPDKKFTEMAYTAETGYLTEMKTSDGCENHYTYELDVQHKRPRYAEHLLDCPNRHERSAVTYEYAEDGHIAKLTQQGLSPNVGSQSDADLTVRTQYFDAEGHVLKEETRAVLPPFVDATDPRWNRTVRLDQGDGVLAKQPVREQREGNCGDMAAATLWDAVLARFGLYNPAKPVSALWLAVDRFQFAHPSLHRGLETKQMADTRRFTSICEGMADTPGCFNIDGDTVELAFPRPRSVKTNDSFFDGPAGSFGYKFDSDEGDSFFLCNEDIDPYIRQQVAKGLTVDEVTQRSMQYCKEHTAYVVDLSAYMKSGSGGAIGLGGATTGRSNHHEKAASELKNSNLDEKKATYLELRASFESTIESLDAGFPVAILYDAHIAANVTANEDGLHYSIIAGYRRNPDTKAVQVLVRNSWGKTCKPYKISSALQCEAETGSYWINAEDLFYASRDDQGHAGAGVIYVIEDLTIDAIHLSDGIVLNRYDGVMHGANLSASRLSNATFWGRRETDGADVHYEGEFAKGVPDGWGTLSLTPADGTSSCSYSGVFSSGLSLDGDFVARELSLSIDGKSQKVEGLDMAFRGTLRNLQPAGVGAVTVVFEDEKAAANHFLTFTGTAKGNTFTSLDGRFQVTVRSCSSSKTK